ncbi:ABC transporter substrate-binding protein [Acetivibrio clariflavus]|uniref:ABC-type nitrate/sulfonate/bicarbonate transport system, periplasmic component n=1 Tax=Acetivibrio clariflavus (strain DSM 19732 / NBRC 101661 / EBR45) TaxID=720554 RepID=G8LZN8_ACECE|nr:ABC transporter substrate-binding protein [Acetivibrio clariflavus]AEV67939.1 ABC-type nitrate/sulfonate/bicarbonate transport system, periplasmic component [Acetivibrio clariflavus DSM 19732]
MKIFNLKFLLMITLIFALLTASSGCSKSGSTGTSSNRGSLSNNSASSGEQSDFDVIRLPSSSNPLNVDTITIAEELGFFREQKIKIERVGIVPWAQLIPSLVSGKLDFASGHINRVAAAVAAGAKVKAVAANTLTTKEKPHMTFVVKEESPIKTPEDILGKKIAIMAYGGCNEYTPYEYLKKNGISDPKGKFEIVVVPAGKEEETLRKGEVEIAGTHDDPANLLDRGGVRILFTDYDIWQDVGGQAPYFAAESFINKNPDLVRRFVTVIGKVNKWINENQEKAIEINAKVYNVDASKVRVGYYVSDAIIKEDTVQLWIDILNGYNELKRDLKASEIYTNEFNPNYKK